MQLARLLSLAVVFALGAHALGVPDRPTIEALPCPQFPSAAVCERNSWEAWEWATLFQCARQRGWDDDCMEAMERGNSADSYAWWDAKVIQSRQSTEQERGDAAKRLHDWIGELRFNWGSMPQVTPYPYERPARKMTEPK